MNATLVAPPSTEEARTPDTEEQPARVVRTEDSRRTAWPKALAAWERIDPQTPSLVLSSQRDLPSECYFG